MSVSSGEATRAELKLKWDALIKKLSALSASNGIALAFSGGLDSLTLLQLCLQNKFDVLALHCTGLHVAEQSTAQAVAWLREHKVPYKVLASNILEIPQVRNSDKRRCYYCKKYAFSSLKDAAGQRTLCDGTNHSDLQGYRPGIDALRELEVCSPFAENKISKPEIRLMAEKSGFERPALSGQTCLLTRFEYGLAVSAAQLRVIDCVEKEIRQLLMRLKDEHPADAGLPVQYRLRYLQDSAANSGSKTVLHLESAQPLPQPLTQELEKILLRHGLQGTEIISMPKISGYFDQSL